MKNTSRPLWGRFFLAVLFFMEPVGPVLLMATGDSPRPSGEPTAPGAGPSSVSKTLSSGAAEATAGPDAHLKIVSYENDRLNIQTDKQVRYRVFSLGKHARLPSRFRRPPTLPLVATTWPSIR